jgi:DNA mismatch repair ATPase MutL
MLIDIELVENALGGTEKLTITDNGRGISPEEIQERFVDVGVAPASGGEGTRLGRLGVGRLAVHRIGSLSTWTTVAERSSGEAVRSIFTLRTDGNKRLKVQEEVFAASPTGTTIEIHNILDTGKDRLTATRIANDLLSQYCSFLLGQPLART